MKINNQNSEDSAEIHQDCEHQQHQSEDKDYQALYLELEEQHDILQQQYARLAADFDNYKKRMFKQNQQTVAFANENLVCCLLPVLDNFDLALDSLPEGSGKKGVEMIYQQLFQVLEQEELVAIDALDQPFDPNLHEAVGHEYREDKPENVVVSEARKGYMLKNKVLRPSMVKVNILKEESSNE